MKKSAPVICKVSLLGELLQPGVTLETADRHLFSSIAWVSWR